MPVPLVQKFKIVIGWFGALSFLIVRFSSQPTTEVAMEADI